MQAHERSSHLTKAYVDLDNLAHNVGLLQELVGARPLWPAIKANAYGHGAGIIAQHLVELGYDRLCVAHADEAVELVEAGVGATFILLSATLPSSAEQIVAYGFEAVVCELEVVESLSRAAAKLGKRVSIHVKVDTGMGRIGIRPADATGFLDRCRRLPGVSVVGLMSHFPRADEADKSYSQAQLASFEQVKEATARYGIGCYHMANSAAIFDLPASYLDAARPGISIYGLKPSATIANPRVRELRPVLEWKTRITFLKDVPAGAGLSYGHTFHTTRPSVVATIPAGYGDGLSRRLSNRLEVLVHGTRCPQVGTITMDQCLIDVTALAGRVGLGDEVVLIGRQGDAEITADELAEKLGTINYEIVTSIARRVPRVPVRDGRGVARWEHFEHEADMGVRGFGATLSEAFEQGATALTAVVADLADVRPDTPVTIALAGSDTELLFVEWLNAVIYEMATRSMLFSRFEVEIDEGRLAATVWGEPVDVERHQPAVEVKGATLTALRVAEDESGNWVAQCIVDV